jgi:hypothetical protein
MHQNNTAFDHAGQSNSDSPVAQICTDRAILYPGFSDKKKKNCEVFRIPCERERETAVESSPVDTVGGSTVSQLVFVYDTCAVLASTQTSTASKLCRNLLKGNSLHVDPLSFVTSLFQLHSGIHNPLPVRISKQNTGALTKTRRNTCDSSPKSEYEMVLLTFNSFFKNMRLDVKDARNGSFWQFFDPRAVHVGFIVDTVALRQVFLCQYHPTNAPYSFIYYLKSYVILATDSVVNLKPRIQTSNAHSCTSLRLSAYSICLSTGESLGTPSRTDAGR